MRFHSPNQRRLRAIAWTVRRTIAISNHQQGSRTVFTSPPPVLRKVTQDGSEVEILEEELYQYTRYRWLSNEPEKLAVRYRRFNFDALLNAAVDAVGMEARSCIKVLKCIEGQFNKAFLMIMNNGIEVLAKIPNPNAGPEFYTTASEVATRNFLRDVLNIPVPRIHAYSLDALNPVGVQYIIEEKARGKPLGNLWRSWPKESQLSLVEQIVSIEARLASVSFQKAGCTYYKSDLEAKGLHAGNIEATLSAPKDFPTELDPSLLAKFACGPLTRAVLWQGGRITMTLDRGPWESAADYMIAMGMNEIQWTETWATPRMNYCRPGDTPELPEEYISLLKRYLVLVPYLSSAIPQKLHSKTLCHPDLHLDNIFVDPNTKNITHIIDWQSIAVSDVLFQHEAPPMLPPPNGYDQILESQPEVSEPGHHSDGKDDIFSHYQKFTQTETPLRWAAISRPYNSTLTEPTSLVSCAWSRNDVFSFRHALITIAAHWKDIAPGSKPCPISFMKHELELHKEEMELLEELGTVLHLLQDQNLIAVGGMVLRENYEQAQAVNKRVKEWLLDMAEDNQQQALYEKIWPY